MFVMTGAVISTVIVKGSGKVEIVYAGYTGLAKTKCVPSVSVISVKKTSFERHVYCRGLSSPFS